LNILTVNKAEETIWIMNKKVIGFLLQIIGFAIIISSIFLLPGYENITAIAVLLGALGGSLTAHGNVIKRHG